jgi:TonB family protein
MPSVFRSSLRLALILAAGALAPLAHAQHYLIVIEANGSPRLVKGAVAGADRVRAEISGQAGADLHPTDSTNYRVADAPLWGPGLIDVSSLNVKIDTDHKVLRVHGFLQSATPYANCFLVLLASSPGDLVNRAGDHEIKLSPVAGAGKDALMPAGQPVAVDQDWSLSPLFNTLKGTWDLHFFSNGLEIPTTRMTAEQIAAARAKSDAYVLRNHPDSRIALRHIVNPTYPEELKSQNLAGSVTLHCQVDRDGNVSAVEVVSATQPAFGRAALEAVRQWKFTPAVKDHHYVAQTAELPITFNPPNPAPAADGGAPH